MTIVQKLNRLMFAASICSPPTACGQPQQVRSAELFGGILEAPAGEWGYVLTPELFDRVQEFGFDHIRPPVSWTYYTQTAAPYTTDSIGNWEEADGLEIGSDLCPKSCYGSSFQAIGSSRTGNWLIDGNIPAVQRMQVRGFLQPSFTEIRPAVFSRDLFLQPPIQNNRFGSH